MVIVAAPLCEEIIFRGLLFKGLKRTLPTWVAVLGSALIFAVIHPAVSFVPVFIMGLVTAALFHHTKTLLAPMVAHAVYNAGVMGLLF